MRLCQSSSKVIVGVYVKMIGGIYKIINLHNSDCYIGSAINLNYRFSRHKSDLKNLRHPNRYLQRAWNKYGEKSFIFEILEICLEDELITREQFYIDTIKPKYNICKTAGSQLGYKHSEETKQKMSKSKKGRKGRKMSDRMKEILKNSQIGLPYPFKGKHHSDKVKKEQSERMKGNKYSVGRKPTQKTLEKMKDGRRRKNYEKLDNKKKVDYLSLDISDWIEKRNKQEKE